MAMKSGVICVEVSSKAKFLNKFSYIRSVEDIKPVQTLNPEERHAWRTLDEGEWRLST